MMKTIEKPYTHILRELRKAFDLKQKEIAEVLGVQPVTYNRYECGKCEMPVRFLIALAQYYDVSTDYILGLSDDLSDNIITIIANQKGEQMIVPCFHLRTSNGDIRHIYPSSGGEKNDVSIEVCNKIHYTKNFWKDGEMCIPKTVCLTEGALIADISAELSGKCFIAIPSVNACGELLKELDFLKKHGCKKIELYFDMDYRTSEDFTGAIKRIGKMIIRSGLKGEQKVWDPRYKRIDDWYLSRKQKI